MSDLRKLTLSTFPSSGTSYQFHSLPKLAAHLKTDLSRLPVSLRIVLESVLRHCDGLKATPRDVENLARWHAPKPAPEEIPFTVVTGVATLSWFLCCGTNFLLNAFWTFHHWPPHWRQALHYYATALLSFVVQILVLNLLVFLLVTERPIETAVLNGVAVATGALLNYLAASLWVFSPNRHPLRRHAR